MRTGFVVGALILAADVFAPIVRDANGAVVTCGTFERPGGAPWMDAMPQQKPATNVTKINVDIASADGTSLFASVYLPDAFDKPLPTVVVFSPYHDGSAAYPREREDLGITVGAAFGTRPETRFFACHGYAVVLADTRGSGNSGGCYDWGGPKEQQDGKAIVDWIAAQEWSDGTVGMRGFSLEGLSQYATAVAAPAALKAIIPNSTTGLYYAIHPGATTAELAGPAVWAYIGAINGLPPGTPTSAGFVDAVANTVCGPEHAAAFSSLDGTMNEYWQEREMVRLAGNIEAAVLHSNGSRFSPDNVPYFGRLWAALEAAGVPRKGIIGDWGHQSIQGIEGWLYHELRWFEHWLRGNDTGVMDEPALLLYDQNGVIRTADDFHQGELALEAGSGTLSAQAPQGETSYLGISAVHRGVAAGDPAMHARYDTEPLTDPLRISGMPVVHLVASLDSTDTDFAIRLIEQKLDGSEVTITMGWLDARHRAGLESPGTDVTPGAVETYVVELEHNEYVVSAGSRLGLRITSSDTCYGLGGGAGLAGVSVPLGMGECADGSGLVPDGSVTNVTIHEGPGLTRVVLPVAPL